MLPHELPSSWRTRARLFRDHGAEAQAATCEQLARELEEAAAAPGERVLTLQEASERGGYSIEHLGELLRQYPMLNAGKKGAPRILQKYVPVRPERMAELAREEQEEQEAERRPRLVEDANEPRRTRPSPVPAPSSSAGARARRAARSTHRGR